MVEAEKTFVYGVLLKAIGVLTKQGHHALGHIAV